MAELGVGDDASCIMTHAYQPCLLQLTFTWLAGCTVCLQ